MVIFSTAQSCFVKTQVINVMRFYFSEIRNESVMVGAIDSNGDRDDVASDSANSGSTITTTTSSVSSSSNVGVLRRVKKTNLKSNNKVANGVSRG